MFIVNKKRLLAIVGMICMAMFVFSFQIAQNENTTETVALPVTGKVVVLDAGHGVPDERSTK